MMTTLEVQTRLFQRGFNPGLLDGKMGKKTIAAIEAFQAANGLFVDGILGPRTRDALGFTAPAIMVSPACIDMIKAWEGVHDGNKQTTLLEPEPDPIGIYTLGWGHALTDANGKFIRTKAAADAWMQKMFGALAITRDQAKALLAQDVNEFLEDVEPLLVGKPTEQYERDALVSFAYNVGVRALSGSTLLQRHADNVPVSAQINIAEAKAASQRGSASGPTERAFGAWSKAGGKWLLGLFRRRMAEAMLYRGDEVQKAIAAGAAIN